VLEKLFHDDHPIGEREILFAFALRGCESSAEPAKQRTVNAANMAKERATTPKIPI
jgi:hypothetical protein